TRILIVAPAADARVAGAQITIRQIIGQSHFFLLDCLAIPRAILPVRGHDYPFFTQRMPSFFPNHNIQPRIRFSTGSGSDSPPESRMLPLTDVTESRSLPLPVLNRFFPSQVTSQKTYRLSSS